MAKFSFNNGRDYDEVNNRKVKLVGVNLTSDRFGNDISAVFLSGNEFSYINLGNYKELKSRQATISLWIKIEHKKWSGAGSYYNPIILTKYTKLDDFYESYAIYYMLESEKLLAISTQDSTRELGVFSKEKFERNAWHHLVISYDDVNFSFYLDGNLEGEFSKNFETKFLDTDSIMVGVTANKKNNRVLNATVDDIEFYDRVLTQSEIDALYKAPNPNKNKIYLYQGLMALALLALILLGYFLIRYYIHIKIKKEKERLELANKLLENELRINRALMNPHFIFNSLNTLHNYILINNIDKASDYLVNFSKLIRKILDSNMSDTISLELEIELIEKYLEIELLRFKEHIKNVIVIDPRIVPSATIIPIMMIQPFIENSIWHGLGDKEGDKFISISFSLYETKYIRSVIEDNGKGRKNKNPNNFEKKSLATGFIQQRLDMLNKIHNLNCTLLITDKPNEQGTIVEILLPVLNK